MLLKHLCDTQAFRVQHSSIRPNVADIQQIWQGQMPQMLPVYGQLQCPCETTPDTSVQKKPFDYKTSISIPQAGTALPFLRVSFPGLPKVTQSCLTPARLQCWQAKSSGVLLFRSYLWKPQDAHYSLGLSCALERVSLRQSSFVQIHSSENHQYPLVQSQKENLYYMLVVFITIKSPESRETCFSRL